jgi:hypothetical protein
MALDSNIVGAVSGTGANVDADRQLLVTTNRDPAKAGASIVFFENDDGTKTGAPWNKSPEVSQDFRMRVGVDTVLFTDTFNATAQNPSNWKHAFTTMTMTQSAGFLNVNAAGTSTVSGNFAYLQTWRYFPLIGTAPLAVEFTGQFTAMPTANEIFLAGLGVATGAAEPVDGVWFELTSAGLYGVQRYNSGTAVKTELISAAGLSALPLNNNAKYVVVIGERELDWWIDDVLYASSPIPNANGQPFITSALPVFIQKYNSALVGSTPNMIAKIGDVSVMLMDLATNMSWANQMASSGLGSQQLNGGSAGSPQIQWANTALPTAAAATNTTAALGAFLGGIFLMNAPATSATDVIIASYQNPLGGANQTPRTIKLRGIKVDTINTVVAVATTASVFAVAVAWGGTALTLAQAETASFANNTAKARRIQPIGVISFPVGAAVGAQATSIQFDFEAPLVINPGEYVQVIAKIILGTATATEVFQWVISPNLYHE